MKKIPYFACALASVALAFACTEEDQKPGLAPGSGGQDSDNNPSLGGAGGDVPVVDNPCDEFSCPGELECVDRAGQAACECPEGKSCEQADCSDQPCDENAACIAYASGGFSCECADGFFGDGFICSSGDPCEGVRCAGENQECRVTSGVAACQCREGFSGASCRDVDECAAIPNLCGEGATCTNFRGGYRCGCADGYELVEGRCEDVDECALGRDRCAPDHGVCQNQAGGYDCSCEDGFFGDGFFCKDVDDCASNPCDNGGSCENSPDGFRCVCDQNYGGSDCSVACVSVTFSDDNLEELVRELVERPTGSILPNDLLELTSLRIPADSEVADLSGLECWSSLEELYLPETTITDLSPLKSLNNLELLDASCADWSSFEPVEDLTQLRRLRVVASNAVCPQLTRLSSFAGLDSLYQLEELNISSHAFTSLAGIEAMSGLKRLYAGDNQLTDISDLETSYELSELVLQDNLVDSLAGLSGLHNLRRLNLSQNSLDDLQGLAQFPSLDFLDLSQNSLETADGLEILSALGELNISFNQLSDAAPLAALTTASKIQISSNQIQSLGPLVENKDFGRSGELWVVDNPLSCSTEAASFEDLESRGLLIRGQCQEP
ncbi:MAG: leucine-rich repeat domain-containing protein [Polyangiaceae bacterium]|nr:leucine-rich repeat domain-containing protein [Polyangiaceae bacterium]